MLTPSLRICVCLLFAAALLSPALAQNQAAQEAETIDARIARLIEQLGASEYSTREKAQAELSKLGLAAFDALSEAQHHDDIEIALRARYLVRSMQVKWYEDGDSVDVQRILKGYGELSEPDRRSRIDRLGSLTGGEGIAALCRLARFETSDELSKLAALRVLAQPERKEAQDKGKLARQIASVAGTGKRTAAAWLRTYAKTLEAPETALDAWQELVKQEHDLLAQFPERTSREIVRDLYRWHATLLQQLGRNDEAIAVMRRTLVLIEGTPQQLAEVVDWLIARSAWPAVQEVADRYPQVFQENAELLYRQAEAYRKQGETERAEKLAQQAFALKPETAESSRAIVIARDLLQNRGLFDWAEREYRDLITKAAPGSGVDVWARSALSEMLHDQGKELAAAEVLQGAIDLMEKNEEAKERATGSRQFGAWKSRMLYFYALEDLEKGEPDKALTRLQEAVKEDPTDADVLIALYRHPKQDDAGKLATRTMIETAVKRFRESMNENKAQAEQAPGGEMQRYYNERAATDCNQLAWLVGNTFGDIDEAIRCSHKSIELRPDDNGGFYDTLGRCYYAKGDFDNAIKYQTQALSLEPHSGQMKRQLDFFIKERDARKAAPQPETPKP